MSRYEKDFARFRGARKMSRSSTTTRGREGYSGHYADRYCDPCFLTGPREAELRCFVDEGRECDRLFKDLADKMNNRYKRYAKMEADMLKRYEQLKAEAAALAEEKQQVSAMRREAFAAQVKTEKSLAEIRNERLQLERTSTDIAVQLAELKRVQREMGVHKDDTTNSNPQGDAVLALSEQHTEVDDIPLAKRIKFGRKKDPNNLKLATVQAALQEDAPGLFELLEEKGLTEDMDIIGSSWEADSADSSSNDEFKELGAVVSKLWGPSNGLVKENRSKVQSNTSWKPKYCLACLTSLIEQTRVLKQRKWPVKWGWCRPMQSFLFVFEKHNRIVLERPEYGYATYFFELMQTPSVKWQVERLIKVMSSVCNSRAALLEDRPLEVGKDLLPQEAEVLQHYGWTVNTGIASLLNFCDRVLHDYKGEDDATEWKSKIGRLLMDGHDQGGISAKAPLLPPFPVKLEEEACSPLPLAVVKEEVM